MTNKHTEKIKKMELILPPAPKPAGVYRPTLVIDRFLYVSGQGPVNKDGTYIIGKVGSELKLLISIRSITLFISFITAFI